MEPTAGLTWQFAPAYRRPESAASPTKYLNRVTALDDALLANSGRPSIRAPLDTPLNSAVELFARAYREPDPDATPTKWAARPADLGDPWPMAVLANTVLPSIAVQGGVPTNVVVEPLETG